MVVVTILVCAGCLWIIWADSTVFEDRNTRFSAAIFLALPVMGWAVLAMVGIARDPEWWRWGVLVPLLVAVTLVLTWFEIPGRVGWAVSRGEMERAGAVCASPDSPPTGSSYDRKKIGVYSFEDVDRLPNGGCRFRLSRDYPVVMNGFFYLPNEERGEGVHGHTFYIPLGGDWYFYSWSS